MPARLMWTVRILCCASTFIMAAGCVTTADATLTAQVRGYFNMFVFPDDCASCPASARGKYFQIEAVSIKDKSLPDKTLTVVCEVTIRVLRDFPSNSAVDRAFQAAGGAGPGKAGRLTTGEPRFEFVRKEHRWQFNPTWGPWLN